ncbi:uncharacterized protein G2W53_030569 [Senna tora]|uniref:Uncharacterized protein n=1 Tax=Senna tora TaxID=362788 RepID=A0A834T7N7_9FABA|nr:uncharacterized protein G2W53_030569 [Senna tora]
MGWKTKGRFGFTLLRPPPMAESQKLAN